MKGWPFHQFFFLPSSYLVSSRKKKGLISAIMVSFHTENPLTEDENPQSVHDYKFVQVCGCI
jgi:hypothetical protein